MEKEINTKKQTLVGNALKFFDSVDGEIGFYTCEVEGCNKKINGKSKSNLVGHLKEKHIATYNQSVAFTSNKVRNYELMRLKLIQNFSEIIGINGRPFNSLVDSGFQKIYERKLLKLKNAGYCLNLGNNYEVIKAHLEKTAQRIRQLIQLECKGQVVALMADIGSKNNRSFLSLNAQFIIHGKLVLRSLGIIELKLSHTAEYIIEIVVKYLDKFGIKLSQIISMTTDFGSNMVKMKADLNTLQVPDSLSNPNSIENHTRSEEEDIIEELFDDSNGFIELVREFVKKFQIQPGAEFLYISGVNCFAHTMQLVLKDGVNALEEQHVNVIANCREGAKFLRRMAIRSELLQKGISIKQIRLDAGTRWCSKYFLVSIFKSLFD